MKRIAVIASLTGLGLFCILPSLASAQETAPPPPPPQQVVNPPSADQNHLEVGAFADYFRYGPSSSDINFVGVGGRVGFNVSRKVAIEGEMNYDFARNYTTTYSGTGTGGVTTNFVTTGVRPLTGLFGPTFYLGSPSAHLFVTGKAGFINFSTSNPNNVSGSSFTGAINNVGNSGTYAAFYPGGGLESFWGPFGIRVEAGDEIYLSNGAQNNLRATVGPVFRF